MNDRTTDRLTIRRPDDWHLHLRDGAMLQAVLVAYRDRITAAIPQGADFTPLMTLYLTEETDPNDVAAAHAQGIATAVKLYPAGATTNSASGVTDFDKVRPVLDRMAEIGMPLCVHGEVTHSEVDIFDREAVFIDRVLKPIRKKNPDLKIVMEHVTTQDAVDYVRDTPKNTGATITTHHLIINRNHILAGGIRPHYYCLPVAKREKHRVALVQAAVSGDKRFFLGTDSAPHTDPNKLQACGCAGVFSAGVTMSCLAEVFEAAGALKKLEAFASLNGPAFYGLPANEATITLTKGDPIDVAPTLETADGPVTVFDPGFALHWHVA